MEDRGAGRGMKEAGVHSHFFFSADFFFARFHVFTQKNAPNPNYMKFFWI